MDAGRNDVPYMNDCRVRKGNRRRTVERRPDRREGKALRALEFVRQLLFGVGTRRLRACSLRKV
ncbi:hypothetical protein AYR66_15555 [Noviherbaspirillum denitrificans]|uniref:Uncharacterized protein n=1 Tax=Noviherbaspirillum denitrificans TaxID=1968433 RepID=A0A254TDG3_9BURK|nr:hypothetical protein AYR66_15555 [Noviherbaspirillum denitrificans]